MTASLGPGVGTAAVATLGAAAQAEASRAIATSDERAELTAEMRLNKTVFFRLYPDVLRRGKVGGATQQTREDEDRGHQRPTDRGAAGERTP